MLAYQFVAGLTLALSTIVAGVKENFDRLLIKARFEEAKSKEILTSCSLRLDSRKPILETFHQELI